MPPIASFNFCCSHLWTQWKILNAIDRINYKQRRLMSSKLILKIKNLFRSLTNFLSHFSVFGHYIYHKYFWGNIILQTWCWETSTARAWPRSTFSVPGFLELPDESNSEIFRLFPTKFDDLSMWDLFRLPVNSWRNKLKNALEWLS